MAKVLGLGGLFFKTADPDGLRQWYARVLGLEIGDWGMFFTPDMAAAQPGAGTVFSPFKADTDYFPADKQYMINLRVEEIDALIAKLEAAGIAVETRAEWDAPETGRFARIHDPEGNPIELWEPPADA